MAETLEIIITAKDEASKVFKKIGDTSKAAFGTALKIGAAGAGALAVGLGASVAAALDAEVSFAKLNSVIESTGGVAGVTIDEAQGLADALAKVTRFSDETIEGGETLLLTFTGIGEDVFPRATETMLNMGEAFGNVDGAAIQLGKALNDPVAGIGALAEVGVSFTEEQKNMVDAMVEAGDVAGAQALILDELEKEFGGMARAAGDTAAGKLAIFKNSLIDVAQSIGAIFLPFLSRGLDRLIEFVSPIGQVITNFGLLIQKVGEFGAEAQRTRAWAMTLFGFETGARIADIIVKFGEVRDALSDFLTSAIIPFVQQHLPAFKNALLAVGAVIGGAVVLGGILTLISTLGLLLNPITLILAAVAGLAIAWTEDWLGMRTFLTATWNDHIKPVLDKLIERLPTLRDALLQVVPRAIGAAVALGAIGSSLVTQAAENARALAEQFLLIGGTVIARAAENARALAEQFIVIGSTLVSQAASTIGSIAIGLAIIGSTLVSRAADTVRTIAIGLAVIGSSLVLRAVENVENLKSALLVIGGAIITRAAENAAVIVDSLIELSKISLASVLGALDPNAVAAVAVALAAMAAKAIVINLAAIVVSLATMGGAGLVAGLQAAATAMGVMAATLGPFLILAGVVWALQTNFGGLSDAITRTGLALEEGDILGIFEGIAAALTAIPLGIADWIGAQVDIDVPEGLAAWKEVVILLEAILIALPGYIDAVIEKATGFSISGAWKTLKEITGKILDFISAIPQAIDSFISALGRIQMPPALTAIVEALVAAVAAANSLLGGNPTTIGPEGIGESILGGETVDPGAAPVEQGNNPAVAGVSLLGGGGGRTFALTVNTSAPVEDIVRDFDLMQAWAGV